MVDSSRKRIYLLLGGFLCIVVVLVVVAIISSMQNKYGEEIKITNLGTYTSGKPSSKNKIDSTQRNLFLVVNMNQKKAVTGGSVKDALVRENTFSQKFNTKNSVHTVRFIVDIESLKQSYNVTYQWADDGSVRNLDEYGTGVTCLGLDRLIYGDFNCVDNLIIEKGKENYDPVQKILPYTVEYKYAIKEYETVPERGEVKLKVEAFVPAWQNKDDVLEQYSNEIKAWLKLKQLDPSKYSFDFIY